MDQLLSGSAPQRVPGNFDASEAQNLEDVSTQGRRSEERHTKAPKL